MRELSKIVIDAEYREYDGVEVVLASELAEPALEDELGEATSLVDEWLLGCDRGMNGEHPELPMKPSNEPLIVDIDDGTPTVSSNRLGALRRVNDTPSVFQKFNRRTNSWE